MIKPEHLRQFLEVSNHSSLAEAAQILNRSPSAISMTLKLIEDHLGDSLFEGDRKKVLTPLGKHVYYHATKAIQECDKALEEIQNFSQGKLGSVSMAAVPSVAALILPKIVTRLCTQFPDVHVNLWDIDSASVALAIKEGNTDFGIASSSRHSQGLQTQWITEEPFMCLLPKEHPLTEKTLPVAWEDLSQFPFIANPLIDQIQNAESEVLFSHATLRIRNISSLIAFVREGFGLTLLPRMAAMMVPDLVAKPIADNRIKRQLYFMQAVDRSLSPVAEIFKQNICEGFKQPKQ